MSKEKEETEVTKAILKLMKNKPFYGYLIQQLSKIFVDPENQEFPTAAVGKNPKERTIKFWVNLGYVKELLTDQLNGKEFLISLIEHEILHVVLNHIFIDFKDSERGNVACDLCCNQYILKHPSNWCTCERYDLPRGQSCYWYYEQLATNKKFKEDLANGCFGEKNIFSFISASHKKWKGMKDDPLGTEYIKDLLRKAKDLCGRSYGNINRDIIEQIEDFTMFERPKINWKKALRLFTANSMESVLSPTIMRISKRYNTRPGTKQEDVLRLACTIDTSGSISNDEIQEFFQEICAIYKNGVDVTVIEADQKVCDTYKFKGKFNGRIHGRGGTNLEPALKYVDDHRFDAHVYFTDFYAPIVTKKYMTPILWILTSEMGKESWPYPYGQKVNLRDGKPI